MISSYKCDVSHRDYMEIHGNTSKYVEIHGRFMENSWTYEENYGNRGNYGVLLKHCVPLGPQSFAHLFSIIFLVHIIQG